MIDRQWRKIDKEGHLHILFNVFFVEIVLSGFKDEV